MRNMTRKARTTYLFVLTFIIFFVSIYHNLFRDSISDEALKAQPYNPHQTNAYQVIHETTSPISTVSPRSKHRNSVVYETTLSISTVSILFPAWEVLVVVLPPVSSDSFADDEYVCLYPNNDTTPAKPAGILPFSNRTTFKCELPNRFRRRMPFPQPVLVKSTVGAPMTVTSPPELLRWSLLVYDSVSTENDVVLFVKGVIKRQGFKREPTEFRCVFGDDVLNGVRTAVTSSSQEVFRCQRPELTAVSPSRGNENEERIKVSLEFAATKTVLPSIAYFTPARKIAANDQKSLLCACTMVYNVAKFLKEWVMYHSRIGVEKFILYDNGSDDDIQNVVKELLQKGYDVKTLFWLWPKTQEAGFSHCAIYAKDTCTWMIYIDVDEFLYFPSWVNSSQPSKSMLQSLPNSYNKFQIRPPVGQFMIRCNEFGPSNQKSHPVMGVTQGYNCRRRFENRHKSMVLLDAINDSLLNVVHHFYLKEGYRVKKLSIDDAVVNHYKFQAWDEFKAKFRRRVSAYVVDWMQEGNPKSNDRTPGLGFAPVEPKGWPEKFCEVYDDRLKNLTRRWFGVESESGYYRMAWQR